MITKSFEKTNNKHSHTKQYEESIVKCKKEGYRKARELKRSSLDVFI